MSPEHSLQITDHMSFVLKVTIIQIAFGNMLDIDGFHLIIEVR